MQASSRKSLLVFVVLPFASIAFTNLSHRRFSGSRSFTFASGVSNDNEDGNFYDDFGDMVIGGDGDSGQQQQESMISSVDPSLQSRFDELVAEEREIESRIEGNWQQGHWTVRGCSLDPGVGEVQTQVSFLCSIDDADVILVGRTDGSICWLQLGQEYLASFVNSLVAKEGANDSIQVTEGLKRENESSQFAPKSSSQTPLQFQVLGQIQSAGGSIVEMAHTDPFLFSVNAANQLEYCKISEDGPQSELLTLSADLTALLVSIEVMEFQGQSFLLCLCRDGQAIVYKIGSQVSPLSSHHLLISEDGTDGIISSASDKNYVYLGTEQGNVWIYPIDGILSDSPDPNPLRCLSPFRDGNAGISAITTAGKGSMSTERQETTALIVGATNGKIKQYELIPRGEGALEYWPKLQSQTIPGKAHIFSNESAESILALKVLPDVILAATSSYLTMWNPASGKSLFGMQGLDFNLTKPSLVVHDSNSLLITNGMKQLVCLHDFSAEELDIDDIIDRMEEN
jgi:hypothetical protein